MRSRLYRRELPYISSAIVMFHCAALSPKLLHHAVCSSRWFTLHSELCPGLCVLQNDISCGVPEAQVLALRYLPHLPPEHLLHLLDKGEGRLGAGGGGSSSSNITRYCKPVHELGWGVGGSSSSSSSSTGTDSACMCTLAAALAICGREGLGWGLKGSSSSLGWSGPG
jgi:hypothetical protein